jgi:hypothetical protein
MEDILEIYRRPYDPKRPLVCMDESTKQLLDEIRLPIPGRIGAPQRYDAEYRRNGVATLFLAFEPLAGWRQVQVTEQRTRRDWAHFIKGLLDERYPDSELEIHYTPKHGSWLNMAEGEFSVLQNQCLDRRIGDSEFLQKEIAAWQARRNQEQIGADWKFTTEDARVKLRKLYPSFPE